MPDWLRGSFSVGESVSPALLAWRIGVAAVLGAAVSGIYRWARRGESSQPTFVATLILLSTVIAMATQVIGESVARAFSLVGALSVVRFRTVVKDTQDTAFVIFAVVVGMAAGADRVGLALIGLGVIGVAALGLWPPGRKKKPKRVERLLHLRVGPDEAIRAAAEDFLGSLAERYEVDSAASAKKGAFLDLVYRVRLRPGTSPALLVSGLTKIAGIEDVELKRPD